MIALGAVRLRSRSASGGAGRGQQVPSYRLRERVVLQGRARDMCRGRGRDEESVVKRGDCCSRLEPAGASGNEVRLSKSVRSWSAESRRPCQG